MTNIFFDDITAHDDKTSIHNFTLRIPHQSFCILLGPSGSGKSLVIKCLQGLVDLASGNIFLDEQDITSWTPKQRNFGSITSSFALYQDMTVYENLALSLKLKQPIDSCINN